MLKITINGVVQGVGFRPWVWRLANRYGLTGTVKNTGQGVQILACGLPQQLNKFVKQLQQSPPPAAQIVSLQVKQTADKPFTDFSIAKSQTSKNLTTLISPDLATCRQCKDEIFDKSLPRYRYAFTNCTNCGPRYSIITNLPYDRPTTAMNSFIMCSYCNGQYTNPADRRFHAQPIACPSCGPKLQLLDANFNKIAADPIAKAQKILLAGKIVGIKGLGGFHLAALPVANTIARLRKLKNRPHKPFAAMCLPNYLSQLVSYTPAQLQLLQSPAAPIVLLPHKGNLPLGIAPNNPYLGVFLPYTPLHWLLLNNKIPWLVMTSGNISGNPLATKPQQLAGLADAWLTHNRPIINRIDDSVQLATNSAPIMLRRARGYAPLPLFASNNYKPIVAYGALKKLCFAITRGKQAILSPHLGEGDSVATQQHFEDTLKQFTRFFKVTPQLAACDLHPDYFTTHLANSSGLPVVKVQHHYAHAMAVMAQHNLPNAIAIVCDGTGLGTDNTIWGGEVLHCQPACFERLYHLQPLPLPGGDSATHHPQRLAFAWLHKAGINWQDAPVEPNQQQVLLRMAQTGFNSPLCSSTGRLFDCVSAILGLSSHITFEAQSALALQFAAGKATKANYKPYDIGLNGQQIPTLTLLQHLWNDYTTKIPTPVIAARFHASLANLFAQAALKACQQTRLKQVVLAGGVMQNPIFLDLLQHYLQTFGLKVYTAKNLPPGDGAIAFGQAAIANNICR